MSGYQISLPVFEGPMDLLLHLIDVNEIDIYHIPIAEVTRQYMDYIHQAEEMDLELTSEFMVMACTLLAIKARMLLPKRKTAEEDGAAPETDPREELIRKLTEYRVYKEKSLELKERETRRIKVFFREPDEARWLRLFRPADPVGNLTAESLADAFARLWDAWRNRTQVIEYFRDEITIGDQMIYIMQALFDHPEGIGFLDLLGSPFNRERLAAAFLAMLELARRGLISIVQPRLFGDIFVCLTEQGEGTGGNSHQHTVSQ
jgi:segregation and condensation protein A